VGLPLAALLESLFWSDLDSPLELDFGSLLESLLVSLFVSVLASSLGALPVWAREMKTFAKPKDNTATVERYRSNRCDMNFSL
jgi:Sec-independent protein secretion pathway component TatC